ncbi:MAG: DUF1841 family protein [Gammaproteobacteria bacterium]
MYSTDRTQMRQQFFHTWQKYQAGQFLSELEQQIVQVIMDHPEYHIIFNQPDKYLDKDFLPEFGETNPYLHLALHLTIRDQIATDRPVGIHAIYVDYCKKFGDSLRAEHEMIECLATYMWQSMQSGGQFDLDNYLESLRLRV